MNIGLKTLRDTLAGIVNNIDAGNSNVTEAELVEYMSYASAMANTLKPMTKYQSAEYLHISRATFDNLVRDGKLPEGKKLYQGDSNLFWYKKDLDNYKFKKQ